MTVSNTILIARMTRYMHDRTQGRDASHDPAHAHRVVALARHIVRSELERGPRSPPPRPRPTSLQHDGHDEEEEEKEKKIPQYDDTTLVLAALLHDVHDRKYVDHNANANNKKKNNNYNDNYNNDTTTTSSSPSSYDDDDDDDDPLSHALIAHGADPSLAARVAAIVSHISYTREMRSPPAETARLVARLPELAIVQDADRLEALGAVGVGRCFAFAGGSGSGSGSARRVGGTEKEKEKETETEEGCGLDAAIAHFGEKLEKLEGLMKTETGREMARVRTERLRVFRGWWEEEMAVCDAGCGIEEHV